MNKVDDAFVDWASDALADERPRTVREIFDAGFLGAIAVLRSVERPPTGYFQRDPKRDEIALWLELEFNKENKK